MTNTLDENIDSMKNYYRVKSTKNDYELRCKKCSKGWAVSKTANNHPAIFLKLLDHARSHKPN